jgi:rare lipoprotein A
MRINLRNAEGQGTPDSNLEGSMRFRSTPAAGLLIAAVAAAGCAPQAEPDRQPVAQLPPVTVSQPAEPAPPPLNGTALARLQQEVPELRETPQPQPQPSPTASPEAVPERVRAALPERVLERVTGPATYYADKFEGRRTASGIPFRQNQMVAAHRAYPFGTVLRVTNTRNNRSVNVRVVDRGPFATPRGAQRPVIDLSRRAAQQLGFIQAGRAPVQIEVLEWGQGIRS